MKITEIALYAQPLPVKNGPYVMSHGPVYELDSSVIRVQTDEGITGWGETCPVGPVYMASHALGARAAIEELAPGLLGTDPTLLTLLHRRMDSLLNGHRYAKSAFDIAAHDITARSYGVRVADLLGGAQVDRVPTYHVLSVGDPDTAADEAEKWVGLGYPRLQIKIGNRPVELDIETIRKVWERVGGRVQLVADANRGMLARDVIRLSRECSDIPIVIEQPCRTLEEISLIKGRVQHPIFIDELAEDMSSTLRTIGSELADGYGMKLSRVGGLRPMSAIRDVLESRSLTSTIEDTWGGDIVAAACVHMGSTLRSDLLEGVFTWEPYIDHHYDPEHGMTVADGHIPVPTGPGLGVVPDESLLTEPIRVWQL